jgi:DNA mismatch repair protein MutS2
LLLLDEFGSGSDPELGGVLAEVFLEELYSRKSFAVITTHYSTIKSKAEQLKFAVNGCMLFDLEALTPLYKLAIGQPGSSFTFEVAVLNGFENELINRAKLKLDPKKIVIDALLHDIQKEKNYLERLIKEHEVAQKEAYASKEYHDEKSLKLNAKLSSQNQLAEQFNKEIQAGKKMLSFIDRFNTRAGKKNSNDNLFAEIKNYLTIEKSKKSIKETTSKKTSSTVKQKTLMAQVKKSIDFEQDKIKTGSLVQLISSKRNGTVESIKGNKVTVIFENARLKVGIDNLRFLS